MTVGPNGDRDAFGRQPRNVSVARYIPQTTLLPFCAAVVSHAGSGTFLAAFARGLPQVCLPQAADQFLNAAACELAGAGVSIDPRAISLETVRAATHRVIADESIPLAAQRLGKEIAAMPAPAAVAAAVSERFGK